MDRYRWLVTAFLAAVVAGHGRPASGQEASRPVIAVAAYNYAGIASTVMASARAKVEAIFEKAGVLIVWSVLPSSVGEAGLGPVECRQPFVIQVMIRPRNAEWQPGRKRIMGAALAADSERAVLSLFHDAMFDVALRYGTPLDDILAVALAHEMGHALLPPPSHTNTGVMQGRWEGDDIRHAVGGLLTFSQSQADTIRERAGRRCALP